MKGFLVALHYVDALLVLALIFMDGFICGEVPVSWLTVIMMDGIVVVVLLGELAGPRLCALRVLWVVLCYLVEALIRGFDDRVFVIGGAALIVYASAVSVALMCTKSCPRQKIQNLKEVVVVASEKSASEESTSRSNS